VIHPALRIATRMLSWLVPPDHRQALLGDLAEEYAQRARHHSSSAVGWWYLRQLGASLPSLLWFALTQTAWLSTLGMALLAFLAANETQFLIRQRIASSFAGAHAELNLMFFVPAVALSGYFSEGLRRRSAIVLGVMMLVSIIPMIFDGSNSPVWLRIAWLLLGPVAALPGILPLRATRS
jgi:hypothetical protein